jgi:hypothetical protein
LFPPVLEWRSFWVSYPPPFSPGDPANLSFAPLSNKVNTPAYKTRRIFCATEQPPVFPTARRG